MSKDEEIGAIVSCMGYGYEVKVIFNGADIGMKGGKSEGKRLFGARHPMREQAPPQIQSQLFVLKPGANTVRLEYKKTGGKDDSLTFEVGLEDQSEPAVKFETNDTSGSFDKTINL